MDRRKLAVAAAAVIIIGFVLHGYLQALTTNPSPGGPGPVHRPEVQVNAVNCFTHLGSGETGVIEIDISNTGSTALDMNPVNVIVRMPNGDINYTLTHRGISLAKEQVRAQEDDHIAILTEGGANEWPNVNSYIAYQINASEPVKLQEDAPYDITLELVESGETLNSICTAETP